MVDFNNTGAMSTTNEWLTPPDLIEALGVFDLDPCAPPIERRPWDMANTHYSEPQDGLEKLWLGRVWLNPPYGNQTFAWLERLAEHKQGIALIFARTETIGFHKTIWDKAHSVFFFKGRLAFTGIISTQEIEFSKRVHENKEDQATANAIRKRVNGKKLIAINDDYSWFKGASANAPSCLVAYSRVDSIAIARAASRGDITGKLINLKGLALI